MARPTKLTPEVQKHHERAMAYSVVIRAALGGDADAKAWLHGQGLIRVTPHGEAWFERFGNQHGRNGAAMVAWRTAVFERDGYQCQECGARGRMHAHHVEAWATAPAGRFDVANGITLCVECHAAKHPRHAALIRASRYQTNQTHAHA